MDGTQRCLSLHGFASETGAGLAPTSFIPAICRIAVATSFATTSDDGSNGDDPTLELDPERLAYLLKLIQATLDGRAIAACYNIALVLIVVVLSFLHWRETRADKRKWRVRSRPVSLPGLDPLIEVLLQGDQRTARNISHGAISSSSSSTLGGTGTPRDPLKTDSVDIERLPLLAGRHPGSVSSNRPGGKTAVVRRLRSWLARQPPPIPVVNKTMPSNGTSVFIASWVGLNILFHLLLLPFRWDFFFVFADKAGFMFVVNLPLLYLLGAKNQPLRRLTGYSYEALNIFHRRVGEVLCFGAAVHFGSMLVWQFALMEDWMKATVTPREYFTHPIILCGIGAFTSYQLLFLTSLGSFRQRWYEVFLASHVFLQAAALVFLWFHYPTTQPYVGMSLAIFLVDRLVWRLALKRADITADISILEDGRTYLLSADWDIPSFSHQSNRTRWWLPRWLQRRSVIHGWQPTDHVFVSVPALGRSHSLQAHPFTIASAAPSSAGDGGVEHHRRPTHAWLNLLIRAQDGFTEELLHHAQTHSRVAVSLDGPYGSSHALDMLRASDCAVLVAGGSGIAVTFPLVWALLTEPGREGRRPVDGDDDDDDAEGKALASSSRRIQGRQSVHMIWLTHSLSHRSWIPQEQLDELVRLGLDLVIPEPTEEAGRPDVAGYVDGWIQNAADSGGEVGVVASGPDGLNRAVRNVCADAIGGGRSVRVAVEKFGW